MGPNIRPGLVLESLALVRFSEHSRHCLTLLSLMIDQINSITYNTLSSTNLPAWLHSGSGSHPTCLIQIAFALALQMDTFNSAMRLLRAAGEEPRLQWKVEI